LIELLFFHEINVFPILLGEDFPIGLLGIALVYHTLLVTIG